jgi:hypothetical protein
MTADATTDNGDDGPTIDWSTLAAAASGWAVAAFLVTSAAIRPAVTETPPRGFCGPQAGLFGREIDPIGQVLNAQNMEVAILSVMRANRVHAEESEYAVRTAMRKYLKDLTEAP